MLPITTSILVDARQGMPTGLEAAPGTELCIAGPGCPLPLPAHASEAQTFWTLVEAAQGQVCVWLHGADRPDPSRTTRLVQAIAELGVPVAGHAMDWTGGQRSERTVRLAPKLVPSGVLSLDTLAFRRDVARHAPARGTHREGTRIALAVWAARNAGVGWVDAVLLDTSARTTDDGVAEEARLARAVQSATFAVQRCGGTPLQDPALRHLLDLSTRWTRARASLINRGHQPVWG